MFVRGTENCREESVKEYERNDMTAVAEDANTRAPRVYNDIFLGQWQDMQCA